jgi:hypothetical protein
VVKAFADGEVESWAAVMKRLESLITDDSHQAGESSAKNLAQIASARLWNASRAMFVTPLCRLTM